MTRCEPSSSEGQVSPGACFRWGEALVRDQKSELLFGGLSSAMMTGCGRLFRTRRWVALWWLAMGSRSCIACSMLGNNDPWRRVVFVLNRVAWVG